MAINYNRHYNKYKNRYLEEKNKGISVPNIMKDMRNNKQTYVTMLQGVTNVDELLNIPQSQFLNKFCEDVKSSNIQTYGESDGKAKNRIRMRIKDLEYLLRGKIHPGFKYLDIGCNDGSITNAIADHFKFDKDNIYGADIQFWGGKENNCHVKYMSFIDADNPILKFPDASFNLVTCYQVLHHNKNVDKMIHEIKRVLKIGGYLILREHDKRGSTTKEVLDMEHLKYMCLEESNHEFKNYIGDYKSEQEWTRLFGMKLVGTTRPMGYARMYTNAYVKT